MDLEAKRSDDVADPMLQAKIAQVADDMDLHDQRERVNNIEIKREPHKKK